MLLVVNFVYFCCCYCLYDSSIEETPIKPIAKAKDAWAVPSPKVAVEVPNKITHL